MLADAVVSIFRFHYPVFPLATIRQIDSTPETLDARASDKHCAGSLFGEIRFAPLLKAGSPYSEKGLQ